MESNQTAAVPGVDGKRCTRCGQYRPETAFYPDRARNRLASWCKRCEQERHKKEPGACAACGKPLNPEALARKGSTCSPECREANKHLVRRNNAIWQKYRITGEQYEAMVVAQGGVCFICKQPQKARWGYGRLEVDHCHETGAVRGLLCYNCNTGLGKMHDDVDKMYRAAEYVASHRRLW